MLLGMLAPSWAMAQAAGAEPFDSGWILRELARPAPAATPFMELRDSPLLAEPLRIEGEYRRPDAGTLVRAVRSPYAETTTLQKGRATIEREGRAPRSFALSRAPELAGLQDGFGALLAGDQAGLERHYAIGAWGDVGGWTMTLAPRDRALARRVRDVTLFGAGDELRCIETRAADGQVQRTLLGSAAEAAAGVDGSAGFERLCRAGSGGG